MAPVLPENAKVNLPRPPLEFPLNVSRRKPGCAVPGFPRYVSAVVNVGSRGRQTPPGGERVSLVSSVGRPSGAAAS